MSVKRKKPVQMNSRHYLLRKYMFEVIHQKTVSFLGAIEIEHWAKIG